MFDKTFADKVNLFLWLLKVNNVKDNTRRKIGRMSFIITATMMFIQIVFYHIIFEPGTIGNNK